MNGKKRDLEGSLRISNSKKKYLLQRISSDQTEVDVDALREANMDISLLSRLKLKTIVNQVKQREEASV